MHGKVFSNELYTAPDAPGRQMPGSTGSSVAVEAHRPARPALDLPHVMPALSQSPRFAASARDAETRWMAWRKKPMVPGAELQI